MSKSTVFQTCRDNFLSSWVEPIKYLAHCSRTHDAVAPVSFEPWCDPFNLKSYTVLSQVFKIYKQTTLADKDLTFAWVVVRIEAV